MTKILMELNYYILSYTKSEKYVLIEREIIQFNFQFYSIVTILN